MAELKSGVIRTDIPPQQMMKLQESLEAGMGESFSIDDVLAVANWAEYTTQQYEVLRKCLQGKVYLINTEEDGIRWDRRIDWSNAPTQSIQEAERIFAETRRKIGLTVRLGTPKVKKLTKVVR